MISLWVKFVSCLRLCMFDSTESEFVIFWVFETIIGGIWKIRLGSLHFPYCMPKLPCMVWFVLWTKQVFLSLATSSGARIQVWNEGSLALILGLFCFLHKVFVVPLVIASKGPLGFWCPFVGKVLGFRIKLISCVIWLLLEILCFFPLFFISFFLLLFSSIVTCVWFSWLTDHWLGFKGCPSSVFFILAPEILTLVVCK